MVVQTRSPRQEDGAPEASLGDLTVTLVSEINKRKKKRKKLKQMMFGIAQEPLQEKVLLPTDRHHRAVVPSRLTASSS